MLTMSSVKGLLHPLQMFTSKFELISLGFITSLPKTQVSYDSMIVVVDRLTKIAHFIPAVIGVNTSSGLSRRSI